MERRRFLRLSLGSALALASFYAISRGLSRRRLLPAPSSGSDSELVRQVGPLRCLSFSQVVVLQAAALRILDGAEPAPGIDQAGPQCRFIDGYLAGLDAPLQDDVRALLELLQYAPLVSHGARFTRLAAAQQDAVLAGWQGSRLDLLRQAFFALKSLCCLAHYQDERSFAAIGYSGPLVSR